MEYTKKMMIQGAFQCITFTYITLLEISQYNDMDLWM